MGRKIDLTGQRFGKLTVLSETDKRDSTGSIVWECLCDCGNVTHVPARSLKYGSIKTCGCENVIDITGKRSGMLVAIRPTDKRTKGKNVLWECKCDCGNTTYVAATYINNEHTQSCGCTRKKPLYERALELTGQKFGRLTALEKTDQRNKAGNVLWKCQCECGNIALVAAKQLKGGNCKSCGCLSTDVSNSAPAIIQNTHAYKALYRKPTVKSTTGVLGVYRKQDKFIAGMKFQGKIVLLETYTNIEDAIRARKEAEKQYYDPFLEEIGLKKDDLADNE